MIASGPGNPTANIQVASADGTPERKIGPTSGLGSRGPYAWSPDGKQIAFVSGSDIHVINVDGTGARGLTSGAADSEPAWYPDGKQIAFQRSVPGPVVFPGLQTSITSIYLIHPDGSGLTQLTSTPPSGWGGSSYPSWSPDGQRLAVTYDEGSVVRPPLQIHLINRDGSGRVNLSVNPMSTGYDPAWSPDGGQIAFTHGRFALAGGQIHVMNADGSNPRRLTTGDYPDWGSSLVAPRAVQSLKLTLTGPRTQRLDSRNRLRIFARCNRDCTVTYSATVRVGRKRVRSKKASSRLSTGRTKLRLKFIRDPARVIRRALGHGRRPVANVKINATGGLLGGAATAKRRIRLQGY